MTAKRRRNYTRDVQREAELKAMATLLGLYLVIEELSKHTEVVIVGYINGSPDERLPTIDLEFKLKRTSYRAFYRRLESSILRAARNNPYAVG